MSPPGSILEGILARKRREVARRLRRRTHGALGARVAPPGPGLAEVLARPHGAPLRVLAEIKFRSPSAGRIRRRVAGAVGELAAAYAQGGAAAISVLADGPGFGGGVLDVRRAAAAVSLPVLFKEFVLDACQIETAAAVGARAVLLLASALDDRALARLVAAAWDQGVEPLVEVATEAELARAVALPVRLIGVNARNLGTFAVDPELATRLVARVPPEFVAVYMSGVHGPEDYLRVAATRADAVLVGEALMRAEDPADAVARLVGGR